MISDDGDAQARNMADTVARRSYGKLVAFLAARTRDVAAAEDALSEAFVSALADWPRNGCPSKPEAWLLTAARRKMIDLGRRRHREQMATEPLQLVADGLDAAPTDADIPDRRLALMFACAHPAIEAGIRAPLILQVLLGLNAATIASAFLMSPATMGQRLVRARTRSARPAFRLAYRNATNFPAGSTPYWTRFTPPSRRAGPTPVEPMSRAVISLWKRCFWVSSSPSSCLKNPRHWASCAHAPRRGPAPCATQCARRIRATCRAGYVTLGLAID